MSNSLEWALKSDNQTTRVTLRGEITETSNFGALLEQLSGSEVVVDLSGVKRINSCGVREWIHFVNALNEATKALVLERCSVPFVSQLNMISNFRGPGRVASVFAPYFCETCNADHQRLLDLEAGPVTIEESLACPTCGKAMDFDDLPQQFLSFTARR